MYENIIFYLGKTTIYSLRKGLKVTWLKLQSSQLQAVLSMFLTSVKLALKRAWLRVMR